MEHSNKEPQELTDSFVISSYPNFLNFSGLAQQDNGGTNTEKQTGFPNQIFIIFQTKFYINMENADRKGFSLAPERAES